MPPPIEDDDELLYDSIPAMNIAGSIGCEFLIGFVMIGLAWAARWR
jgi:hypothetical protein